MRPFRSFLLLLLILSCLTGLLYIIPGNQNIPFLDGFITYSTSKDTMPSDSAQIAESDGYTTPLSINQPAGYDTLSGDTVPGLKDFPHILAEHFDSASSAGKQIRIMYYGDSQLEGDRITDFLRKTLAARYGGTGPGLFLPLMPVMYTKTINIRSSSNWSRYNYLSFRNKEISHNSLGPFMTICRYLPEGIVSESLVKASVQVTRSQFADSLASRFDVLRLFYGNVTGAVRVSVRTDNKLLYDNLLGRDKGINEISTDLNEPDVVNIEFTGTTSPDIYGISIEDSNGIVIDNIPQRGSAGLEFTMVDRENLGKFYSMVNPDLFVLQYGLNLVKNLSSSYDYFEDGLYRQIKFLNEICPTAKVLVISISDMAFRSGDSLKSYPNIRIIRDAQERATIRAGAGFWDSFEAMGGESAIIGWSETSPPMAERDLVHFTYTGADTLSRLLFESVFSWRDSSQVIHPADTVSLQHASPDTLALIPEQDNVVARKGYFSNIVTQILTYEPGNPFIFTTVGFWIFLLFVLAGYSLIYRKLGLRSVYLFIISLYFYYKTGGLFLFLLILVTVVDYACGWLIHNSATRSRRKFFIILSLVSNLGLLAYFKYAGFITDSLNSLLGTGIREYDFLSSLSNSVLGTSFDINSIILPVGISFFTFQSLSYTIDIYRGKMEPVRNIIDFGFFVSFFPHLVAGPIVRASVFIPQIYQEFRLTSREFSHALFMISKGLIKKIVVSNFIAINFIDRVFDAPAIYSGFENLMAIYGYGLQIYCDFSGYTDIAIGVALILGFRLPVNFNSPYKATSIADFWRRWHISLSQWLKDYLYISLGGNRKGRIRTYFNLMVTMLLGGLWHGASLRFIIWGGLHGIGLVIGRIWNSVTGKSGSGSLSRIIGVFITFNFVSFCWIFFRAESIENIRIMLNQIGNNFNPGSLAGVLAGYSSVFLLIAAGYLIHFLPEKIKESYRGLFIRSPLAVQMAIILLVAVFLYQMRTTDVMPFIYFRF